MDSKIKISITNFITVIYLFCFLIISNGTYISTAAKIFFSILVFFSMIINYKKVFNAFSLWLVIYTLFVLSSVSWALYGEFAIQSASTVVYTTICSLAIPLLLINNKKDLEFFYKIIIVLPLIYYIYYLIFYDVPNIFDLRQDASNQIYNNIGLYAAYSFLFVMIYQAEREKRNIYYDVFFVIDLFLIIISQSRKSFIYIGIIVILSMILESKNVLKTLLRILLVFVLLFIAYQVVKNGLFGDSMKELLLSFEGDASDSSYVGRMNQFDISIGLFNQNRFLGLGIGTIEYVCRVVHGQSAPIVDNDYLDILSDLGIIGMVIYYGFHVYLLIQYIYNKKKWNKKNLLFFVLLIILFIQGFLIRGYFNNYYVPILLYLIYYDTKTLKQDDSTILET